MIDENKDLYEKIIQNVINETCDDILGEIKRKYLGVHPDELYEPHYAYQIVDDIKNIIESIKA